MACWDSLPAELQLSIWEHISGPNQTSLSPPSPEDPPAPRCAQYAAVARDWQHFFESRSFYSVALYSSDIHMFYSIIKCRPERLQYMRWLRYTIDLPEYTCFESEHEEDAATIKRNNVVFTHALLLLVRVLALWKMPEDGSDANINSVYGMQLELGVRSTSDFKHSFQDYRLKEPYGKISTLRQLREYLNNTRGERNNPRHGWNNGSRTRLPYPAASCRVLGGRMLNLDADGCPRVLALSGEETEDSMTEDSMEYTKTAKSEKAQRYYLHHGMQAAPIVRKLAAGRNFYRSIHPATLAQLLRFCFPRVEFIKLEPWRPVDAFNLSAMERGFITLVANLPPSLRVLNFYLESNSIIHPRRSSAFAAATNPKSIALLDRRPSPRVGQQLAVHTRASEIEVIGVFYLAEAEDFFNAALQRPTRTTTDAATVAWPKLKTLMLTSSKLTPKTPEADISRLLLLAADTVIHMTKLRDFELTFHADSHICKFSVKKIRNVTPSKDPCQKPIVTYKTVMNVVATWDMSPVLTDKVMQAWRAVAEIWTSDTDIKMVIYLYRYRLPFGDILRNELHACMSLASRFLLPQSRIHMLIEWLLL